MSPHTGMIYGEGMKARVPGMDKEGLGLLPGKGGDLFTQTLLTNNDDRWCEKVILQARETFYTVRCFPVQHLMV